MKKFGMGCMYGFAIIGVLVVLCAFLGVITGRRQQSGAATPSPRTRPAAVSEVQPAAPTLAAAGRPLAEQLANTQRSGVSPDMVAYLLRAAEPAGTYGEALSKLGERAKQVGDQPQLLRDPTWQRGTLVVLSELKSAGQQLGNVQPVPAEARRVDNILDQIAAETERMTAEYGQVVEQQNFKTLGSATRRLARIADLIGQAGRELRSLQRPR